MFQWFHYRSSMIVIYLHGLFSDTSGNFAGPQKTFVARQIRSYVTWPLIKIKPIEGVVPPKSRNPGKLPLLPWPSTCAECKYILFLTCRKIRIIYIRIELSKIIVEEYIIFGHKLKC